MKLRMERTGSFHVNWTGNNANQCGTLGQDIIHYRVVIESSDKYLDQNGFIIDNNQVHQYFVSKYKLIKDFVSCELLAATACRDFRKQLKGLYSISVSGNPSAAWLTAHWARADGDDDHKLSSAPQQIQKSVENKAVKAKPANLGYNWPHP